MPLDVLHHDDGVIHHQPDGKDDGQQGQQVDGEAEDLHQKDGADQRHGNGHHRDEHRAEGAEKEKDDDHDDEQGVAQGLEHLVDGILDIIGGVVGDPGLHAGGQLLLDGCHLGPHPADDIQGVGVGQRPDTHEYRGLTGKMDLGVIILGPQDHLGDILRAGRWRRPVPG